MSELYRKRLAVLTSGGDAQGMNAAVRAVVRAALENDIDVFAIKEGYYGMVVGGDYIVPMTWDSVGGILQQGGTIIGTVRCKQFRTRDGRRKAAQNLLTHHIDNLVVIGGDGSLTGAHIFRQEWQSLLVELVDSGLIAQSTADAHPNLNIVGLVGSIDNDMFGTDMTIGADTALHRITEAVDAISSTAASHQRTFVVEVMGRHCGYLALMGALATGADWVLIPESPPDVDDWGEKMCQVLKHGRETGKRDSIVIVAEGAIDRDGNPITSRQVKKVLEEHLEEEVRITVLGHVQRGGAPSAYDRTMSTQLGFAAVQELLAAAPDHEPQLIGVRNNRITHTPLMHCVEQSHAVAKAINAKNFDEAMRLRGNSFVEGFRTLRTLIRALPHDPAPGQKRHRFAVMNIGAPAPGMNTAVRAAVRLGLDKGHEMLGIYNGVPGFIDGQIEEMNWMTVAGWASRGGSELGTNRVLPHGSDFYAMARAIEEHRIDGLLIIGGWTAYETAYRLFRERNNFPAFKIPIVCMPASIDNNLPGSELSIGADTALNSIVEAVDKIKQSAVASRRCFVVEVMGHNCGYLALMSGLATGAERVYLPEEGITLHDLQLDVEHLKDGFRKGKRLGLMIRSENANPIYTTNFIEALFEEEGGDLFEARHAVLGHLQQGGDPTPFDRILATRFAIYCIDRLIAEVEQTRPTASFIGLQEGHIKFNQMEDMPRMSDRDAQRPKEQWWMSLRPIARVMAQPCPHFDCDHQTD